jgi:hypothetical protein
MSPVPRQLRRHPVRTRPDGLDLYGYRDEAAPKPGRPPKHDLAGWRVVDDWPERVPVTSEELDVFEAWFGEVLDELFGPV